MGGTIASHRSKKGHAEGLLEVNSEKLYQRISIVLFPKGDV